MSKLNAAFKRWFRDSKIVDSQGKPLVVYHGSFHKIDTFKEQFIGEHEGDRQSGAWGRGFYFSQEPKVAAAYGPNVAAYYLSIQNPLVLDFHRGVSTWNDDAKEFRKMSGIGEKTIKATEWALVKGYDGVVLIDTNYDGKMMAEEIVAFKPTQIKSVDNDGTWNTDDPKVASNPPDNILYDKDGCRIEIVTPEAPGGLGKWRDTFIHFTDKPGDAAAIVSRGFDLKKFGRTAKRYDAAQHLWEHDPRGVYAHAWEEGAESWGAGRPYVIFTAPVSRAIYYDKTKANALCGKTVISQLHGGKTGTALQKALLRDGIQAIFTKHSEQIILDMRGIEFVGGHGIDY